jgi:glycosyltransferase involved in cell wall biosynthesis
VKIRTLQIGRVWQSEDAGGADRVLADLARYLPRYDIGLEAIVTTRGGDGAPAENRMQTAVFSLGDARLSTRARWIATRRAVRARLAAGRVDMVASHFALYASAVLDRLRGIPHVVHFHGPWAAESLQEGAGHLSCATKWAIERLVYASADRVIVLSEAFAAIAQRTYGIRRDQIRVVPGAVDVEKFAVGADQVQARETLCLPQDRPILVTVRRLVHRTGVDKLIEALPMVVEHHPAVLLCIGGTGPLRRQLQERVTELDLEPHVRFLGYIADRQLPLLYGAANLNVVPTLALEGFGLTAVEALAAGTPSIVTPVGGLPEAVGALSRSLVLASADPRDIAEGLVGALSGSLPMPTAAECRAFARDHFSADLMARRTAAVYEEVCA